MEMQYTLTSLKLIDDGEAIATVRAQAMDTARGQRRCTAFADLTTILLAPEGVDMQALGAAALAQATELLVPERLQAYLKPTPQLSGYGAL